MITELSKKAFHFLFLSLTRDSESSSTFDNFIYFSTFFMFYDLE